MIKSKSDLREYLEEDRKALGIKRKHYRLFLDVVLNPIWKYEILLRKAEYYKNNPSLKNKLLFYIYSYRKQKLGLKCNFTVPLNVCGKGLNLAHIGPIIINGNAKIGDYCRIHVGVNIGTKAGFSGKAPSIGNNVYIGPGAKLFDEITIADNIAIGANAVVNKSFLEPNIAIAGVPAKKINDKGSSGLLYTPLNDVK
ncbi:MAG: serine acetyltransferase [Methanocorpusculum sp.]|nr:serine acetyltransferase [Methanocorpusculum sp.]